MLLINGKTMHINYCKKYPKKVIFNQMPKAGPMFFLSEIMQSVSGITGFEVVN